MYLNYYDNQIGGGVKHFFAGSCNQRGRGVGSWLGGLFRGILPYLKRGAKAVGKEALRTGMHVWEDITEGNGSVGDSWRTRSRETRKTLQKKAAAKFGDIMRGSGYKSRKKIAQTSVEKETRS